MELRNKLLELLNQWQEAGIPTRWELQNIGHRLCAERRSCVQESLWQPLEPPLLVTATIDDGWGHGIELINLFAEAMGMPTQFLGLLQAPEEIVRQCQSLRPDLLGLTVLQFDSEPALKTISEQIPASTRLLAGGPVFKIDPELAERAGVDFVARNVGEFLQYVLGLPGRSPAFANP